MKHTQSGVALTGRRKPRRTLMIYLLGVIIGLLFIIMCITNGRKQENAQRKADDNYANNRKQRDLNEEDLFLLANILSVGLVDADPNYLQHLKCFRDLRGGAT